MTDRAHPAAMNASDLWLMFYKLRIENPFRDLFGADPELATEHGGPYRVAGSSAASMADYDLAEFRKRYPHRVHDDKEGAE